jgi:hypothetical protein
VPRATVYVTDNFARNREQWEREIQQALVETGRLVTNAIHGAHSQYNISPVAARTVLSPVGRARRGFDLNVIVSDFRALWFEKGTYRKLGAGGPRSRAGGGNRGMKPQRFMRNALRAVWPRVLGIFERRMH